MFVMIIFITIPLSLSCRTLLPVIKMQPRIKQRRLHAAVLPVPFQPGVTAIGDEAQPPFSAPSFQLIPLETVAAGAEPPFGKGLSRRLLGGEIDDAAGGVAIQAGRRPADHLGRGKQARVDVVDLPLPVGGGFRQAVHYELYAADAEGGAGAEAPNGNAGVLGEVVGIEGQQAGHVGQGFIQGQLLLSRLDKILGNNG